MDYMNEQWAEMQQEEVERAAKVGKKLKRKARAVRLVDPVTDFIIDTGVVMVRTGCGDGGYWTVANEDQEQFSTAMEQFVADEKDLRESHEHEMKWEEDHKATQREFYERIKQNVAPVMDDPAVNDEHICVLGDVMWAVYVLADVSDKRIVLATLKAITKEVSTKRFWNEMNAPEKPMSDEQLEAEFVKAFGMTQAEVDAKCVELSKEAQS